MKFEIKIDGEKVNKWLEEQEKQQKIHDWFYNRWTEKLHKLTTEQRIELVHKMNKKYRSIEYVKRWYKRGLDTPESLCNLAWEYAHRYGREDKDYGEDHEYALIVDDHIVVRTYIGQGSCISVAVV